MCRPRRFHIFVSNRRAIVSSSFISLMVCLALGRRLYATLSVCTTYIQAIAVSSRTETTIQHLADKAKKEALVDALFWGGHGGDRSPAKTQCLTIDWSVGAWRSSSVIPSQDFSYTPRRAPSDSLFSLSSPTSTTSASVTIALSVVLGQVLVSINSQSNHTRLASAFSVCFSPGLQLLLL